MSVASNSLEEEPIFLTEQTKKNAKIIDLAEEVYKNLFPKGEKIPNEFEEELTTLKQILKNLVGKGKYIKGYSHIYKSQIIELQEIRNKLNETPYISPSLIKLINILKKFNNKSGGGRRCATTRKQTQHKRKRKATRRG
jgi:hypothetical protein